MNKLIKQLFFALCLSASTLAFAAEQPSSSGEQQRAYYIEIQGVQRQGRPSVDVTVSPGSRFFELTSYSLKEMRTALPSFHSMVDAMNWLGERGWTLATAYSSTSVNGVTTTVWVAEKKVYSPMELLDGFVSNTD